MTDQSHTIFGRSYPREYDAILVGGGIGGLFCSNLLASEGLRVLLLERHYVLGGFCSAFRRHGFVFDAATHFYPLLGNPATLTGKLLRRLGVPTEWVKMDPVDQFHFPGMEPFAVPAEFTSYIAKLKACFPDEAGAIDHYFEELRQAYLAGLLYYFRGLANDTMDRLERFTMREKLDEHFHNQQLKAILMADCLHWGSLPDRTSYVFDAMLRLGYFLGNYYPRGGSQKFADDLGKTLERNGGRILKCAEARRIVIRDGKARGVVIRTVSKRPPEEFEFRAPIVISNGDAIHTYRDLIGVQHLGEETLERLQAMTPSYPCFLVHLGLKGMDPEVLAEADGYHWTSFDPVDSARNAFKIFIPTKYAPEVAPPGCQILIVQKLSPVRVDEVLDWKAHKAEVEGGIMARLGEILPGIERHIVYSSSATAMTSFRFTNNWQGAMLGWEMSPRQLGTGRPPVTTPIRNLYLTGHWTQPGGGVTPVIVSAQRVANAILTGREDQELAARYLDSESVTHRAPRPARKRDSGGAAVPEPGRTQRPLEGGRRMIVQLCGFDGPLARATRAELERRGHTVRESGAECAIFFPGALDSLEQLVGQKGLRRLVLRSHAYAYGSSTKNPGFMTEERVSLLPLDAKEQRWLKAEEITRRHPGWAAVRLTNVLAPEEGDLLLRQMSSRSALSLAGHDCNVQFIGVEDAARALVAAAESDATGLFNASGEGALPLKKVLRAAGTRRIALPRPVARALSRGPDLDQLQSTWTVSSERARKVLGFAPRESSVQALASFLKQRPGAHPERLRESYDDWGLDADYIRAWGLWFAFLRNVYWRIEHEGVENVPETGRALLVPSHRGFMPLDAVMHLSVILENRNRVTRFLIIHTLLRIPFLCNFLTRMGGVIASQENAARLLATENLVGIFPEGIRGAFTPYRKAYRLRGFAKSGFARIAVENQAPVIPVATVGHAEIFPILGRIESEFCRSKLGWPYLPIAPMFPLAPVPIPSKWHVRMLPPVGPGGLRPADADNPRLMAQFSEHIQHIIQINVDDMVKRRKSIFFGKFLDGTAPPVPAYPWPQPQAVKETL
ncbi:MAG: FAD-dependent oxidoreductase [Acidobacteria bacterium]|nr:FAD-dependent oxidoreductase [Acidobacteriota bacterium]